jgi:broad specificity phosphatase PhoE
MSPAPIYLFRHGETEWSRSGRHTGRTDVPLTEAGKGQARRFRPVVEAIGLALVLSSPLTRAVETMTLAGAKGDIRLREELREWDYGRYEGITTEQIRRSVPGWTIWTHPCPGGETLGQVEARADAALALLGERAGPAAVFSHGHFLRVLAARWVGLSGAFGRALQLDTGSVCELAYEHGSP